MYFIISGIRGNCSLNLYFTLDRNTNTCVDDFRHIPLSVEDLGMICILVAFKEIMGCVVLHLVPTPSSADSIMPIITIKWLDDSFVIMGSKKFYTLVENLTYSQCRGDNLCAQTTLRVENVNIVHYRNVLNLSNIVIRISMVLLFIFPQSIMYNRNRSHDLIFICTFFPQSSINFPNLPSGNHSDTNSMMWPVYSILKKLVIVMS